MSKPCGYCVWCLFNLKWHGRAYLSLCTSLAPTEERERMSKPCGYCVWCLFNLKWHGRAYSSLCTGGSA